MRGLTRAATGAALMLWVFSQSLSLAAEQLEMAFENGRVTLIADEVPLSTILDEWSRLGDTQFVDADAGQLPRQPVQLQLVDVPEADALRILLRDAAGFIAAPRAMKTEGASRFDRVLVMATSRASATNAFTPVGATTPAIPQGQRGPMVAAPAGVNGAGTNQGTSETEAMESLRRVLPQPFDPSQTGQPPAQPPDDSAAPTASRPGMPVTTTEESAPVFIRPVRPQTGDR